MMKAKSLVGPKVSRKTILSFKKNSFLLNVNLFPKVDLFLKIDLSY